MLNRAFLPALCVLLAGCATDPPVAEAAVPTEPLADSDPFRATYDLIQGISGTWHVTVGEPGGDTGRLAFTLFGPGGAPVRMDALCFGYSYEQRTPSGLRGESGRKGACGGGSNLSVAPELAADGDVLFLLEGTAVLPGTYAFQADGGPQLASLLVELVPR